MNHLFRREKSSQARDQLLLCSMSVLTSGTRAMNEPCICILAEENREPAPECELPTANSPGCGHWREKTLRRLEAWIEEREGLIAEIDRRIQEEAAALRDRRGGAIIDMRSWNNFDPSRRAARNGAIKD
jgi:hypothetical protein